MPLPDADDEELRAASEQGRICALAAKGQRDLQRRAAAHRELFPDDPFDPTLFSNIAMAIAFIAPWSTAEQLVVANRSTLWGFGADWQLDYLAKATDEVDEVVTNCLAVADGAAPAESDPLGGFLAEIRDELAASPAFGALRATWRGELERMLLAMAREWQWKAARTAGDGTWLPTFDEYLGNADNLACSFVNVSHWIYTADSATLDQLPGLIEASAEVQRVLRLVNDLATYERDLRWGDLNALMLVADRAEVTERMAALVERARELVRPLRASCPREATYLTRQIGFTTGFYQSTDFWGIA